MNFFSVNSKQVGDCRHLNVSDDKLCAFLGYPLRLYVRKEYDFQLDIIEKSFSAFKNSSLALVGTVNSPFRSCHASYHLQKTAETKLSHLLQEQQIIRHLKILEESCTKCILYMRQSKLIRSWLFASDSNIDGDGQFEVIIGHLRVCDPTLNSIYWTCCHAYGTNVRGRWKVWPQLKF